MKRYLLIPLIVMLFACGSTSSNISSNLISSNASPISSISSNGGTSSLQSSINTSFLTNEEITGSIDNLINDLQILSINVNHNVGTQYLGYFYATDADPIEVSSIDNYESYRYSRENQSDILVRKGSVDLGGSEDYVIQIYHDDINFYQLCDFTESLDTKQVISYDQNYEEYNLSLSFTLLEINRLQTIKEFIGMDDINVKINLCEIDGDGEYEYSYLLTMYEKGTKIPTETLTYEAKFILENNKVIASHTLMEDAFYAGGVKLNYSITETSQDYEYGDYKLFEGTLFNPDNFQDVNDN